MFSCLDFCLQSFPPWRAGAKMNGVHSGDVKPGEKASWKTINTE